MAAANSSSKGVKMASDGLWQGENPLDFALPLLAVQIVVILVVTQGLALSLSGRCASPKGSPRYCAAALDTVSGLGLLLFLFLFLVAVAAAGIVPPLLAAPGLVPLLKLAVPAPRGSRHASFLPLCVFLGAALAVTAMPVLACILKELGLLATPFGETAMAAAAVNDVFAWALLALALAVSGGGHEPAKGSETSELAPVYILASGFVFVAFMLCAVRPLMARLGADRAAGVTCSGAVAYALLAGAATDAIGVHPVFVLATTSMAQCHKHNPIRIE
ncbi:hypothetical protein EJB05_35324, partial [Eragrostis curvula]